MPGDAARSAKKHVASFAMFALLACIAWARVAFAQAPTSVSSTPAASAAPPADASASVPAPEEPKAPPPARPSARPTPAPSASATPDAVDPPPEKEPAVEPAPAPPPAPPASEPSEVRVGDTLAFVLRVGAGDQNADARARAASHALKDAFELSSPEEIHVERAGDLAIVYLGKAPIVQLSAADARAAGDASLDVHADAIAAQLEQAVRAEKARSALASRIFSVCLIVFFGVVVLYLWRKIGEFSERANDWLEDNPHRIPTLRVRSLLLLNPAAFRTGIALAISVGKWVGQFAVVYLWLLAALSLFETTRGYSDRLNGFIVLPFVSLAARVASSLPIIVVVAITVLSVAILFRVVGLFFQGVREGTTAIEWLPPELARPTGTLVRAGLVLVTLVFAAPVLTGNPEGALTRAGLVGMVTLGLASVPLVASAVVGVVVVYGRRLSIGEYAKVGLASGKVIEVGLIDVTIEDDEGQETRVPHLVALLHPTQLIGAAPRVVVRVGVDRARANAAMRERLLLAISSVGTEPRVEIEEIERDDVHFALSVVTEELDARSRLNLLALDALDSRTVPEEKSDLQGDP